MYIKNIDESWQWGPLKTVALLSNIKSNIIATTNDINGRIDTNTNDINIAKAYYVEACRISPRFDDPKLNLTALYFNQKEFEKADSCLKTLLHDSERRTKYQTMVNAFLKK